MRTDLQTGLSTDQLTSGNNARLAEHYTDILALNWRRRARLLESSASDFADLLAWDARIQAALDALQLLGPVAQDHLQRCLQEPIHAGETFAVLAHGLSVQQEGLVQAAVAISLSLPGRNKLLPALIAGLEWSRPTPLWLRTVQSLPLLPRLQVLATCHRDATPLLAPTFEALHAEQDSAPDVLAAALRCLQYLGDARAIETGAYCLESGDGWLRLSAARALLALRPAHEEPAIAALQALVREGGAQREAAARCLALHAPAQVLPLLDPGTRLHLQALGWAGRIEAVPRLVEWLDNPQHARVAAASITLLTGSDPVRDSWQGPSLAASQRPTDHASTAVITPADPDATLPWPSRDAFAARWRQIQGGFTRSQALLGGRPATTETLRKMLHEGPLAWRALAAARLQRLTGDPLFPTRLPAPLQAALF